MLGRFAHKIFATKRRNFTTFNWIEHVKARVSFPAPPFNSMAWHDNEFKRIKLDDYTGQYVVLFFYPLDFTDLCQSEITAFQEIAPKFLENDCQLISCSVDSHFTHREFASQLVNN